MPEPSPEQPDITLIFVPPDAVQNHLVVAAVPEATTVLLFQADGGTPDDRLAAASYLGSLLHTTDDTEAQRWELELAYDPDAPIAEPNGLLLDNLYVAVGIVKALRAARLGVNASIMSDAEVKVVGRVADGSAEAEAWDHRAQSVQLLTAILRNEPLARLRDRQKRLIHAYARDAVGEHDALVDGLVDAVIPDVVVMETRRVTAICNIGQRAVEHTLRQRGYCVDAVVLGESDLGQAVALDAQLRGVGDQAISEPDVDMTLLSNMFSAYLVPEFSNRLLGDHGDEFVQVSQETSALVEHFAAIVSLLAPDLIGEILDEIESSQNAAIRDGADPFISIWNLLHRYYSQAMREQGG